MILHEEIDSFIEKFVQIVCQIIDYYYISKCTHLSVTHTVIV